MTVYRGFLVTSRCSCFIWSQKVELSQVFCEILTLPKSNINWKENYSIENKFIGEDDFRWKIQFVCLYNISILQEVNTIPSLYPPLKWTLPFYPRMRCQISFTWIFALKFHFILILSWMSISQKTCDSSTFWLHIWKERNLRFHSTRLSL